MGLAAREWPMFDRRRRTRDRQQQKAAKARATSAAMIPIRISLRVVPRGDLPEHSTKEAWHVGSTARKEGEGWVQ